MLRVKGLSFCYKSTGQRVLNNLTFDIKKGETVAILGPSGCGKTTLLNYIQGLNQKEVELTGKVQIKKGATIRTVFQEPRLLPWRNALDNVAFGLEASGVEKEEARRKALKTLALVGLKEAANRYSLQLSLGMQQRVNFARALTTRPDLILMDEPFSALDVDTKNIIMDEFKEIIKKNNFSTLFVTHNLAEAKILADKIIKIGTGSYEVRESVRRNKVFNDFLELDE